MEKEETHNLDANEESQDKNNNSENSSEEETVSYTHLTLPTNYSV